MLLKSSVLIAGFPPPENNAGIEIECIFLIFGYNFNRIFRFLRKNKVIERLDMKVSLFQPVLYKKPTQCYKN